MSANKLPFGAPTFSSPLPLTTGKYLFVCSVNGSNGNTGLKPEKPLATIQKANDLCTADAGDVVVIMPGHAEAVTATSHALNKAGVQYVGLGTGVKRPTLTYGAAAATIAVSADNIGISNCRFIANFLDVAAAVTLSTAKGFQMSNCDCLDTSAILNFLSIVVTGATNNAADGLAFVDNFVYGLAATDGAVVSVLGNLLRLNVSRNVVDKPGKTSDTAALITMSSKVCGGVRILDNILTCVGATAISGGILFTGSSTTSSGMCARNLVTLTDTSSAIIATTGTKISFSQNFMGGAVDASGVVWPAADTPS